VARRRRRCARVSRWSPRQISNLCSPAITVMSADAVIVDQPTQFGEPPSDPKHLRVDANSAQSDGGFNKVAGGSLHTSLDLADWQLSLISDYKVLKYRLQLDDDATGALYFDGTTDARVENHSQEFRAFRDFGAVRLTTGLYYLHINAQQTDLQKLYGLGGIQVLSPFTLRTNSYSAFAQGEVDISPKVTLIGGFRATRERKAYDYAAFAQTLDGAPIATARTYQKNISDWLYSWKTQLDYRPVRGVLVYASYSRGTKAGSFNAPFAGSATPVDAEMPYKAEKLDSFELGAKTTLADGLVTLNGSVFYYDYSDYQAFKFVNFATVVANNPAREKGGEIELRVRPTRGLEFMGGASYVDASVKDVQLSNSLASGVYDRTPPFTSKWQLVGSARYSFDLAGGQLALQSDVQYRSRFFYSLTNFQATKVKAYALLNGRVSWTTADERWELAVFGKNLTDKRYRTVGFEASDFGGFTQVGYGEPRWLGVSLAFKH
jgi:iron complex outermembrane receptor protein